MRTTLTSGLVAVGLVAMAGSSTAVLATPGDSETKSYLVDLAGGLLDTQRSSLDSPAVTLTSDAVERAQDLGATVTRTFEAIGGYAADLTPAQVKALESDPAVARVRPNRTWTMRLDQRTAPESVLRSSFGAGEQKQAPWPLDRMDQKALPLDQTYRWTRSGKGVRVFIFDSGIRETHQEVKGRLAPGFSGVKDGKGTNDCLGHGTNIASLVAGKTFGVAKEATLIPVRVFDCKGSTDEAAYTDSLNYLVANAKAGDVVNASMGGPVDGPEESWDETLYKKIIANGASFVTAAGNERTDACACSPARIPEAITVGSSDQNDGFDRQYSNFGKCVDILAPGVKVTAAWSGSDTDTRTNTGTSAATPHVAGTLALFLEGSPKASPADQQKWLESVAVKGAIKDLPAGTPNLFVHTAP